MTDELFSFVTELVSPECEPASETTPSASTLEPSSSAATLGRVRARLRSLGRLPNHLVLSELLQLNCQQHRLEAELLLFLGELDQRQLYREHAVSSAFEFCVSRLGYAEDVAWKRVGAARLVRRFPRIYELLVAGRIHLTAVMLLKPYLTEENHEEWLLLACNKSKRQIEKLVATRHPRPDVPASIRKLPVSGHALTTIRPTAAESDRDINGGPRTDVETVDCDAFSGAAAVVVGGEHPANGSAAVDSDRHDGMAAADASVGGFSCDVSAVAGSREIATNVLALAVGHQMAASAAALPGGDENAGRVSAVAVVGGQVAIGASLPAGGVQVATAAGAPCGRALFDPSSVNTNTGQLRASPAQVEPLSRSTYRVTFTASEQLKEKLNRAAELLSHTISPSDVGGLVERALDCLLEREEKRRYGGHQCKREDKRRNDRRHSERDDQLRHGTRQWAVSTGHGEPKHVSCQESSPAQEAAQYPDPAGVGRARSCDVSPDVGHARNPKRRRHVPVAIRRAVFERDGGQCTYVDAQERRCCERRYLEFDHSDAYALGGGETVENLRLRCRCHNQLEAERLFGRQWVKSAIKRAQ